MAYYFYFFPTADLIRHSCGSWAPSSLSSTSYGATINGLFSKLSSSYCWLSSLHSSSIPCLDTWWRKWWELKAMLSQIVSMATCLITIATTICMTQKLLVTMEALFYWWFYMWSVLLRRYNKYTNYTDTVGNTSYLAKTWTLYFLTMPCFISTVDLILHSSGSWAPSSQSNTSYGISTSGSSSKQLSPYCWW